MLLPIEGDGGHGEMAAITMVVVTVVGMVRMVIVMGWR